ncbi:MAG: alpha/beta hydrolase fold domain-containing protein [Parvibaculaceae bacterium]|nr:alpha/beta hydrolase fold domain-containing protein [Parvibaculaceae bacterium]
MSITEEDKKESVNIEAVRAKYALERDRRIRNDRNEQYVEIAGDFAYFEDDPYVSDKIARQPLSDVKEVIIVGGGFGGLLAAAQLRKAEIEDIRIIEKGGDFGGTWYWNRYPGAQCDIESYIYFPLLEEVGGIPSKRYAFGDEIHDHTKRIADHFDLYQDVCFQTQVTKTIWHEEEKLWEVQTDQGDIMRCRFLCMANGPLNRPRLPGIPGIETYQGHTFHTSRWDYAYTGGSLHGGLTGLADKRVAIIGTGATAIQCVPHLAETSKHLFVVQRTPTAVDERNNCDTDEGWVKELKPGWHAERCDNFTKNLSGVPMAQDLVADGWTDAVKNIRTMVTEAAMSGEFTMDQIDEIAELADYQSMQDIRDRAARVVDDQDTAEKLKPYYRKFCKRPGFHDQYLASFNRSNVTLVDTDGQGVQKITEKGFVVAGKEYEVDCIIFATGFEVGTNYTRRSGYDVVGRNGLTLSQKWADGPKTLYGMQTRDFPNMFVMGPVHGATSFNLTQTLNEEALHLTHAITQVKTRGATTIDVSAEAEKRWGEIVTASDIGGERADFFGSCTPGYYNGEGDNQGKGGFWEFEYAGGPADFFDMLRDWRVLNHMPGLEIDGVALAPSDSDVKHLRSKSSIRVHLHRDMKNILNNMELLGTREIESVPIKDLRLMMEGAAALRGKGPQDLYLVEDCVVDSDGHAIPVRVYKPTKKTSSIILYHHGGGFCVGSIQEFDAPMRRLAKATGSTVVSVEYRLAPEAPFPAAIDDASAALVWADANRTKLAVEGAPLFVSGDSAGGNISAVLCLLARDELNINIAGQILLYPATMGDVDADHLSAFESPLLNKAEICWFYDQYIPNKEDRSDLRFAPIKAESHADLPPALVLTAEYDLLRPEGEAYAARLMADGTKATVVELDGALHGFFSIADGLVHSEKADRLIAKFIEKQGA